jgi:serine protease Do
MSAPRRHCVYFLSLMFLFGVLRLQAAERGQRLVPRAFDKTVPENLHDLEEIQDHVRRLVERVLPCTVALRIGPAQGSGVIIDDEGHVLTAGHVSGAPGRKVEVLLHDGRKLHGITLGANAGIDSGLVRITDRVSLPHAERAPSAESTRGQWCLALGHPGGYQAGRAPVVRLGRVLEANNTFLRTDCALVGGDSGGPLFDMEGRVIGIHSRIGGSLTANIHVPVDTYHDTWERLTAAEAWGSDAGLLQFARPGAAYLGVETDPESRPIRILTVAPDSPAARAGVRPDDVLLKIDDQRIGSFDDLGWVMRHLRPGTEVTVFVRRGEQTRALNVVLGNRPD